MYKAKAESKINQKYYWRNPNNPFDITYGLERNYPGWIATDMMVDKDGRATLIKAYEPGFIEPEPIVEYDEPIKQKVCKFRKTCPFYTGE